MTVSLATLRSRVRQRADQQESDFVSDSEIDGYINEGLEWVHYEMVCSGLFPEESVSAVNATGASSYNLPELVSVVTVERVEGGTYIPLRRAERAETPSLRTVGNGEAWMYDISWSLRAAPALRFYPNPTSGSYQVRYIPAISRLTADGDLLYAAGGWDTLIVIDAAIKCVRKEGGDSLPLESERQEQLGRLRAEVYHRDAYHPPKVHHGPDSTGGLLEPFAFLDRQGHRS